MNFQHIKKITLLLVMLMGYLHMAVAQNYIQLMPPTATSDLRFGGDGLAIHKDKMLVGVSSENKAYYYTHATGLPAMAQTFTMPQNLPFPNGFPTKYGHSFFKDFGKYVALSDDMLAINYASFFNNLFAHEDTFLEDNLWIEESFGAQLYTFDNSNSTWVPAKVFADMANQVQFSGDSVFLHGHAKHIIEVRNIYTEINASHPGPLKPGVLNTLDTTKFEILKRNGQSFQSVLVKQDRGLDEHDPYDSTQTYMAISPSGATVSEHTFYSELYYDNFSHTIFRYENNFYDRTGGTMNIVTTFEDSASNEHSAHWGQAPFFKCVALNDDYAVVGVYYHWHYSIRGLSFAKVFKLDRNQNQWVDHQTLDIKIPLNASVVMDENRFYIEDSSAGGRVVVYQNIGNQWKKVQTLISPSGQVDEEFGSSLALYNDVLLVGAPGNDLAASDAGAVYVYTFNSPIPDGIQVSEVGNHGGAKSYISYESNQGKFAVSASGDGITGIRDGFTYLHRDISGNSEVVIRLDEIDGSSSFNLTGLMIRESLNDDATNVFLGVDGQNRTIFQERDGTGNATNSNVIGTLPGPRWLKLTRNQGSIEGYYSQDGQNWNSLGSYSPTMSNSAYIGVAVSSSTSGNLIHVDWSQLTINGTSY